MKRLLISGANGRMGRMLAQEAAAYGFKVVAGVDKEAGAIGGCPVYAGFLDVTEEADILIDFSSPNNLGGLVDYAVARALPCVLGTTGYTAEDLAHIRKAAERIPVFQSPNMSRGVYVLRQLAAQAAKMLDGFDIEIVEKHHNQKADSPSGTALALYEAVRKPDSLPVYGREGVPGKRQAREIGLHAVRGGTVPGEHEVGFYGGNEVILLSHSAQSRGVFASGALAAAAWLLVRPAGLYGMADLMGTP